jgi:hypothetical protein
MQWWRLALLTELLALTGFGCKNYPALIYSSISILFSLHESYPCFQSKSGKKKKSKVKKLRKWEWRGVGFNTGRDLLWNIHFG